MSIFADGTVIKRLKSEFIPFAGDTHELQNNRNEASRWFMTMAKGINQRVNNGTTSQGFYVCSPEGTGYVFNNNRSPDRVLSAMDKGMASFSNATSSFTLTEQQKSIPSLSTPGAGTLVVDVFSRITPLPKDADSKNAYLGRDHLWIFPDEIARMATASPETATIQRVMMRIMRFHLVDNVRGEPEMWERTNVTKFTCGISRVGSGQTYRVSSDFAMQSATCGYEGKLTVEFTVSQTASTLTSFRGIADGSAWGSGRYTQGAPQGRFPLKIAFTESRKTKDSIVPPQGLLWGGEYRNPPVNQ